MKNKSFFKIIVVTIVFFGLQQNILFSQSVDIDYKTRLRNIYSASIFFSDKNGTENIQPEEFLDYDHIYFTITVNPNSQRDHFRTNDIEEDLILIELYQEGKKVHPSAALKPINDVDGRFTHVLMTFPKDKIKLYKPFIFKNELDTTDPIELDEKFYKYYFHYHELYSKGKSFYEEKLFTQAFDTAFPIAENGTSKEEMQHYSFFKQASETLFESIINEYADSLFSVYNQISEEFLSTVELSALHQCDSVRDLLKAGFETFSPYFDLDYPKSKSLKSNYQQIFAKIEKIESDNYEYFKINKLSFFEKGNYEEFKFRFFIDAIARLLTYTEGFQKIDSLNRINIGYLDNMPLIKNTLIRTDWKEDFEIIINLINEDIATEQKVFNTSIMANLESQKNHQHQPYFEIFTAFNAKHTDPSLFNYYLNEVLKYCSYEEMIKHIEIWSLCYRFTVQNISQEIFNRINNGIQLISQRNWPEAAEAFSIISMQASFLAPPWYYAAVIDYEQNDDFSAESKFNLALDRYPEYISPRIYLFDWLHQREMYEELYEEVNKSLGLIDIWLFHYWKAKTLVALGNYPEAIERITNHCHQLNPFDVQSWFLLGDAYFFSDEKNKARQAYQRTQQINPFSYTDIYNDKMQKLFDN